MDDLESILNGNEDVPVAVETPAPEPQETPAVAETPAEPVKAEQPRGPDGKFAPKGETIPAEPEAASPAAEDAPLDHAALIGERRRRQEAEQRLQEMERQLQQRLNQPAAPTVAPDRWEDPEGYDNYLKSEIVQQARQEARQEAFESFQYQRIAMSAEEVKARLPDYPEKMQVFEQMMQGNPQLLNELYRAPNPAEYAYNTAKTQLEISQYGGLEGLINARVQEALKASAPAQVATIPETLAGEQSARGNAQAHQPPSLEDLLK